MVRWWKKGTDQLVAYDKDLVVWVSGSNVVQEEMVDVCALSLLSLCACSLALEALSAEACGI